MLELGNTQVAQFAGSGALMELDKTAFENSDTWLGGLEESSTYDGKLVAVPTEVTVGGRDAVKQLLDRLLR